MGTFQNHDELYFRLRVNNLVPEIFLTLSAVEKGSKLDPIIPVRNLKSTARLSANDRHFPLRYQYLHLVFVLNISVGENKGYCTVEKVARQP